MERVGVLARAELAGQPRQCADARREAYHASRVKLPDRLTPGISTWSFVDSVRRGGASRRRRPRGALHHAPAEVMLATMAAEVLTVLSEDSDAEALRSDGRVVRVVDGRQQGP